MVESLFPAWSEWLKGAGAWSDLWFLIVSLVIVGIGAWRMNWRNRYARRMKQTFENSNLFVKPQKDKLFPYLISLSDKEDELFYVFRYRLRPGMSLPQFEEKKKMIEASFHAETKVFGKGGVVTIKVKKQKHPVPMTEQST
jgi:hypothetical protein